MRAPLLAPAALALAFLGSGCDFTRFDDLADEAPAQVVRQDEEISRRFPAAILGLPAPGKAAQGGVVLAAGAGPGSLAVARFDEAGEHTLVQRELATMSSAIARFEVLGVSADPTPPTDKGGPFAWCGLGLTGSPGRIARVDAADLDRPPVVLRAPATLSGIQSFGTAVATARLGGAGPGPGLAVGAQGSVVLWRSGAGPGGLGTGKGAAVRAAAKGWPARDVTVLAAGPLDPRSAEDEVVALLPDGDVAGVIHGVAACFAAPATPCASVLAIPRPRAAGGGTSAPRRAALIGDVDGDGRAELVLGAPERAGGRGAVDIYDLEAGHFDGKLPLGQPRSLAAPQGARGFGASLAFAAVGDSTRPLLIVGAPDSAFDGVSTAGVVYLFDRTLAAPVSSVGLAKPEAGDRLGSLLGAMPFAAKGRTAPVLVAATADRVVVFFAGVTSGQRDRRAR